MFLENDVFNTVIASTPLVSIDLVVKNNDGDYLLGYRNNRPAKGYWFVPGGRILKDESFDMAFLRLTQAELGISVTRSDGQFLGPFEHFYDDNVFGNQNKTHYVVLAYELILELELSQLPSEQHGRYAWFSRNQILSSQSVHQHSKWYVGQ